MPVYNGGVHLAESVWSCARAGLDASQYEILVVDNCSTDGAPNRLPTFDQNGAAIQVHRNSRNIGRVANWNRCVDIAVAQGFQYATFLFAGDLWVARGGLRNLFSMVRQYKASIGLSPFYIANDAGVVRRCSQRFYLSGARAAVLSPRSFLKTLLSRGLFPLGPLQANIYRLSTAHPLRFDESTPTVTDVRATLDFIRESNRDVVVTSTPFLAWRERSGRFHASMGTAQTMKDYFNTFQAAYETLGIPVDCRRAKAGIMINCARLITHDEPVRRWPRLFAELIRTSARSPYTSNAFCFLEALWTRFALRRHALEIY